MRKTITLTEFHESGGISARPGGRDISGALKIGGQVIPGRPTWASRRCGECKATCRVFHWRFGRWACASCQAVSCDVGSEAARIKRLAKAVDRLLAAGTPAALPDSVLIVLAKMD